jgi:hypothetical protein
MPVGKKTGGRKKGVPNKLTQSAKEAFQLAFDDMGGWKAMTEWAKSDPDNMKTFYTLYARLIPVDVKATVNESITVEFKG